MRRNSEDILVDYRVRQFDGAWKIIDITPEGVSTLGNLRSQFGEIVTRDGADGLLAALRRKNAEGRGFDDGDAAAP